MCMHTYIDVHRDNYVLLMCCMTVNSKHNSYAVIVVVVGDLLGID